VIKNKKNIQKYKRLLTSLVPPAELGGTQDSSSVTLPPESYSAKINQ